MGQIGARGIQTALSIISKGKLQDLHARQSVGGPQFLHVGGDDTKVLGDEGQILAIDLVQMLEKGICVWCRF